MSLRVALGLPINIELSRISQVFGDRTERATPVPIPNTEVKPLRADGTARATAWETRSLPGVKTPRSRKARRGFSFYALLGYSLTDYVKTNLCNCSVRDLIR